jgi:phosphoribosylamine--glycine ligase
MGKCRNLAFGVNDFNGIERICLVNNIGLVIVGPEVPLAHGITDHLRKQGLAVFGPTQAGAQIESSKAWAKTLMKEAGIPTARSETFTNPDAAIRYVIEQGAPIVIKADGLAAGKGVTVAPTLDAAKAAVQETFEGRFGDAGQRIVVEDYLTGQEASVLAVTDGLTIRPLLPAQDHKPIGEGDTGPNTGGMGAYAPTPVIPNAMFDRIQQEILEPAIATLQRRGIDYRGVLYAGLMITPDGDPNVIEFNCRFGDPETQAILPLLETPLEDILLACAQQRLAQLPPIAWKPGAAACVVMAANGYPGTYVRGHIIKGIPEAEETGALVFHAGTRVEHGQVISDGGRVLGVTGTGDTFKEAIANAYQAVSCIQFEDAYYRRDIGYRVL